MSVQQVIPSRPKDPEKDLFVWQIAARPYKKRSKEYYTTIASIVLLVAIILLFIKEWLLIVVIFSLTFVSYALATVKPETVSHKITTWGIVTGDKKYKWEDLARFWFSQKFTSTLMHVETRLSFPRQLILLVNEHQKEVEKIVGKYLTQEIPDLTFMDKAADWLQKKVPLETDNPSINSGPEPSK
jgi:transcription termination factor NusB